MTGLGPGQAEAHELVHMLGQGLPQCVSSLVQVNLVEDGGPGPGLGFRRGDSRQGPKQVPTVPEG